MNCSEKSNLEIASRGVSAVLVPIRFLYFKALLYNELSEGEGNGELPVPTTLIFQRKAVKWIKISEMMMCKDFVSLPIKDDRFKVMHQNSALRPNSIYPRSGSIVTGIGPCGVHAAKLAALFIFIM